MDTELKTLNQTDEGERPLLKPSTPSSSDAATPSTPTGPTPSTPVTPAELEEMEKKFAAYVRHDVYGPMGLGDLPLIEKVLLCVSLVTLVPLRFVLGISVLVLYYLICRACTMFTSEGEDDDGYARLGGWRRLVIVKSGRFLSRVLLFVLGFYWISNKSGGDHIEDSKDQSEEAERPGAIVSNHVSYLDILYHMSASFPSFVAKRSVGKLPLIGLISKCLGCVYVQREDKSSDFKGVSGIVTERVKEAHADPDAPLMLLFPEGTTTNGDFLLPFKSGAFVPGAPVVPVILRYPYQRFSPAWDSISGVRHVILLLCQFVNYMEVTRLPVYYPSEEEKEDPKVYANSVRKLMANEGNLVLSDIGLPEKRIYHAALNGNNRPNSVSRPKID